MARFGTPGRLRAAVMSGLLLTSGPVILSAQSRPPAWFLEEVKRTTSGGGRWIADNSAYRSPDEPADQYGLEWRSGLGGTSMTGRLFGLSGGKEIATYWQFLVFWHPGRQTAVMLQINATGVVGEGTMVEAPQGTAAEQVFSTPAGGTSRIRHESVVRGDERYDRSFDWVDGAWRARRSYTWRRSPG
jgi:hypothetical protein